MIPSGAVSDKGVQGGQTIGTETENLLAVYAEISSLPFVDPKRVFLMGGSMGGFVSALAAERLKEKVRALILYFPALCIPDNWTEKYPDDEQIPEIIDFWSMKIGRKYVKEVKEIMSYYACKKGHSSLRKKSVDKPWEE